MRLGTNSDRKIVRLVKSLSVWNSEREPWSIGSEAYSVTRPRRLHTNDSNTRKYERSFPEVI
jgi:hypothetical protein